MQERIAGLAGKCPTTGKKQFEDEPEAHRAKIAQKAPRAAHTAL